MHAPPPLKQTRAAAHFRMHSRLSGLCEAFQASDSESNSLITAISNCSLRMAKLSRTLFESSAPRAIASNFFSIEADSR